LSGTIDQLKQETNKYAITNVLFHHIGNDMPKMLWQAQRFALIA
jgi:hypothetical protein